jgi:L,D-peptidoglycan transpeptidase YkuD (ErfK/YbiS/YcfS/YnhG family)
VRPLVALLLFVAGCGVPREAGPVAPPASRQVITVQPIGAVPNVEVRLWERNGDSWRITLGPWPGVVGSSGIAPTPTKREGDKRTPAGCFPLGPAFGEAPAGDTRLDYFQATANDFWIDDPVSPDYNRRVVGPRPSCSHERLRRDDHQYRRAAVIGYNTEQPVPGRGSAIFLHVWRGPGLGTDGCVALAADHVDQLLRRLDKSREPVIVIRAPAD